MSPDLCFLELACSEEPQDPPCRARPLFTHQPLETHRKSLLSSKVYKRRAGWGTGKPVCVEVLLPLLCPLGLGLIGKSQDIWLYLRRLVTSNGVGLLLLLSLLPANPALYSLLQPQRGEGLSQALGVGPNPTPAVVPPWCCTPGSNRATSRSHIHRLWDQLQPLAHLGQYKSRKTAGPEETLAVSIFQKPLKNVEG